MFKHFIITRFNLKLIGLSGLDINGNPTGTDIWLKNRFELFEKFCLPSVARQTNQNFTWMVLFDHIGIPNHIHKIEAYKTVCPQFQPFFFDKLTFSELLKKLTEAISLLLNDYDEYVLTTRLDNDDAIHIEMIETLQSCFPKKNCYINFPYGYLYDTRDEKTYLLRRNNTHFVTRIESTKGDFRTVMQGNHIHIDQLAPVYNVKTDKINPKWIEVVHNANVLNAIRPDAKLVDILDPFEGFR